MGTRIDGPGRVPGVSRICPPPLNTAGWCHLARTHVFYFRRTHYAPTPTHTLAEHAQSAVPLYIDIYIFIYYYL